MNSMEKLRNLENIINRLGSMQLPRGFEALAELSPGPRTQARVVAGRDAITIEYDPIVEDDEYEEEEEKLTDDLDLELQVGDVIEELLQCEADKKHFPNFVGVKAFRDRVLIPRLSWAKNPVDVQSVLRYMQDENIIVMDSHVNPIMPEFPTTGIRLNRDHPKVQNHLMQTIR